MELWVKLPGDHARAVLVELQCLASLPDSLVDVFLVGLALHEDL